MESLKILIWVVWDVSVVCLRLLITTDIQTSNGLLRPLDWELVFSTSESYVREILSRHTISVQFPSVALKPVRMSAYCLALSHRQPVSTSSSPPAISSSVSNVLHWRYALHLICTNIVLSQEGKFHVLVEGKFCIPTVRFNSVCDVSVHSSVFTNSVLVPCLSIYDSLKFRTIMLFINNSGICQIHLIYIFLHRSVFSFSSFSSVCFHFHLGWWKE